MHPVAFGSGVSQKLFAVSPGIAPQRCLMELPDDVGLTGPQADPMPVDGDLPVAMAVCEVLPSGCGGLGFDEGFQPCPLGPAKKEVVFLECLRPRTLRDAAVLLGLGLEVLDGGAAILKDQMRVPVSQIHEASDVRGILKTRPIKIVFPGIVAVAPVHGQLEHEDRKPQVPILREHLQSYSGP